ncbi:Yip1 family protein [Methanofollis formosanus]|nr:Yip1 family protein [Methanofollis formosanus]
MSHWIVDLLLNPDTFFREREGHEAGLKFPLLFVLLAGLAAAPGAYVVAGMTGPLLPPEAQSYLGIVMAIAVVAAFFSTIIFYIVFVIVFYLLSLVFKGSGDIKKSFEAVGYGYLPLVVGYLLSSLAIIYYAPSFVFPQVDLTTPAGAEALNQVIASSPMTMISSILGILFMLWAANIWIFGMRYARSLTLRNAAITVGVPVGIYIIFQISALGVL